VDEYPAWRAWVQRIDALMHAEPAPEPMTFDSDLDPTSHAFSVRGANNV